MDSGADLAERLVHLRQHQQNGQRSPHKPLLVLLALGKLMQGGSSRLEWSEVEPRLSLLLAEFGPPRKGLPRPEFPFTRLRSDLIWTLSRDVPMDSVRPLREEPISGQFVSALEDYFSRNNNEILRVARAIVEQQFPLTVAPDVLVAVGLDPEAVFAEGIASAPANEVRRRSSAWRHEILQAWDRCCAFCGFDGQMVGGPVGIEAAHVRWFNFGGPDALDNGVALCSLHHKLLDRGVLGFMNPQTVMVSSTYTARSEEGKRLYDLHLRVLHPRRGTDLPHTSYVAWHRNEVFQGDPLGP